MRQKPTPEQAREYSRRYRARHSEKLREANRKRRADLRQARHVVHDYERDRIAAERKEAEAKKRARLRAEIEQMGGLRD
jgi:hypothetical protein